MLLHKWKLALCADFPIAQVFQKSFLNDISLHRVYRSVIGGWRRLSTLICILQEKFLWGRKNSYEGGRIPMGEKAQMAANWGILWVFNRTSEPRVFGSAHYVVSFFSLLSVEYVTSLPACLLSSGFSWRKACSLRGWKCAPGSWCGQFWCVPGRRGIVRSFRKTTSCLGSRQGPCHHPPLTQQEHRGHVLPIGWLER